MFRCMDDGITLHDLTCIPPGGERKLIDSKVPAGRGHVSSQEGIMITHICYRPYPSIFTDQFFINYPSKPMTQC